MKLGEGVEFCQITVNKSIPERFFSLQPKTSNGNVSLAVTDYGLMLWDMEEEKGIWTLVAKE